jgi:hypothetical protein
LARQRRPLVRQRSEVLAHARHPRVRRHCAAVHEHAQRVRGGLLSSERLRDAEELRRGRGIVGARTLAHASQAQQLKRASLRAATRTISSGTVCRAFF